MDREGLEGLMMAVVDWYGRARVLRDVRKAEAPQRDWGAVLHRAREALRSAPISDQQRWVEAVKHVQKALPRLTAVWDSRPINTWCHGDLHPGNVMTRQGSPGRPPRCVLIDLALVHPGHWVEDAVYLERLYWGRPELLHGVKPVSAIARLIKDRGLYGGEDYALLANVRRVLMGACAPAYLEREGNARYLHSALEHVEKLLPLVG
jgi:aminoglycoside phosphotransferase (APT) family kinase protein